MIASTLIRSDEARLLPEFPEYLRSLKPYVPGKPIEETQREFGVKKVVKLASNENPLGISPKALQAIKRALTDLHRYPDASAFHLKKALAKKLKATPEQIVLGNGSNEVIEFLLRALCRPGDQMVTSEAAFIAYGICAQIQGVQTLKAPLAPGLKFDLQAMAKLCRDNSKVKIVFVANPNNPTGTYVGRAELESFLQDLRKIPGRTIVPVLDDAYGEYVTAKDFPDSAEMARKFSELVVLRTFSKIYGMAGLRLGYGIARPELAAMLDRIRQPFNFNNLALAGARAAIDDTAFVKRSVSLNQKGLALWRKELQAMGVATADIIPTQGNFFLMRVWSAFGVSGGELAADCLKQGLILRPLANYGLHEYLRVSIGTEAENRFALKVLKKRIHER